MRRHAVRVFVSLLVVAGPPGVGKSTVAALVADRLPRSVLVVGDAFFDFVRQGFVEPWRPESHAQNGVVTDAAALAAGRYARDYPTIFDGVMGPWFLDAFVAATGLEEIHYAVLLPDVEVCVERVMTRQDHVLRNEDAARRMHANFVRAAVDARHVVVNHSTPNVAADELLDRWGHGDLRYGGSINSI
jgi:cytidylate kinase